MYSTAAKYCSKSCTPTDKQFTNQNDLNLTTHFFANVKNPCGFFTTIANV